MGDGSADVSEQERLAFSTRQRELLKENSRGTAAKPVTPKIGDQYGELTVRDCLGTGPNGTHLWLLNCSCGCEAIRDTRALNWAVREGMAPQCPRCLNEKRGGIAMVRRLERQDRIRSRWEEQGTLWTGEDCLRLMENVRGDLEQEFGATEWTPRLQDLYYDDTRMWSPPATCPGAYTAERERVRAERVQKDAKKWKRLIQGKATTPLLDFVNREDEKKRRSAVAKKAAETKARKKAAETDAKLYDEAEAYVQKRIAALEDPSLDGAAEIWRPSLRTEVSTVIQKGLRATAAQIYVAVNKARAQDGSRPLSRQSLYNCLHAYFLPRAEDEEIVWEPKAP